MGIAWGSVVVALSVVCWGGQAVAWFAPDTAVRLSLSDAEDDVEPSYWADSRGEAIWDVITLWTMPVAGVLLVLDHAAWPYFGLVGGGMYLYFSGRVISTRVAMLRSGFRVGDPAAVRLAFAAGAVWGVMAAVTVIAAVVALESA